MKNIDAERAAFNEWFDETMYREDARDAMEAAWLAARRTPSASIGEDGVPELPRPIIATRHGTPAYTVGQMLDFARDAIAADRRAREEAHTAEMAQWARDNGLNVPLRWVAAPPLSSEPQTEKGESDART